MIRSESSDDAPAIRRVHECSFPSAGEARLVDALRDAGRLVVSLVAVQDAQVIGHVAFSDVHILEANNVRGLGLAPVAVLREHRRRGVADRLIRAGLTRTEELGYSFAVVLGDPSYYRRFGFRRGADRHLRDEFGGGDAFQAIVLPTGVLPKRGGTVRYAKEFNDLDGGGEHA